MQNQSKTVKQLNNEISAYLQCYKSDSEDIFPQ